jgi:hypothetical protein
MGQFARSFSEVYTPDKLISGLAQVASETLTMVSGEVLARGTVMGRITSSGAVTISLLAASDGSQNPYGILADNYDSTAGAITVGVYTRGSFNENALTLGTGQTIALIHDALRSNGIFLTNAITATAG